eukprot:TRINITY_DN2445_c0_g1_i1.p1 TRINITY_DN2445_c0_g1~~TRINITY_DN2445_c0_g1_i1.p1  ORF type:complete len:887 (-),score=158.11 TRINITY_DN2445_c0_g1_i1:60-2720(-)
MGGLCGCCRGQGEPSAPARPANTGSSERRTLKDYLEDGAPAENAKDLAAGFDGVVMMPEPLAELTSVPSGRLVIKQVPERILANKDGTYTPSVYSPQVQSGFQTPSILHEPHSESSTVSRGTAPLMRSDSLRRGIIGGADNRTGDRIKLAIQNRTLSLKKHPSRKIKIGGRDMRRLIAGMNTCLRDIHILVLTGNLLDEQATWMLGEWLRINETLRVLEVMFCGLNTRTACILMQLICTSQQCALRTVNLSFNNLDITCARTIAKYLKVGGCPVQNLILRCNPITVRGVADLISCPSLQLLDCSNCFLDPKCGIDPLVQALKSTNLSCLKLQGNNLSEMQVATLRHACSANPKLAALANGGLVLHNAPSKANLSVVPKPPSDRQNFAISFPRAENAIPLDDDAFLGEESDEERDDDFMEIAVLDPGTTAQVSSPQCKLNDLLFRGSTEDPAVPLDPVCTRIQVLRTLMPTLCAAPDDAEHGDHLLDSPARPEPPSLGGARCLWLELPRAAIDIPFDPAALREQFGRQQLAQRAGRSGSGIVPRAVSSTSSTTTSSSSMLLGSRSSRAHPVTSVAAFLKKYNISTPEELRQLITNVKSCTVVMEQVDDLKHLSLEAPAGSDVGEEFVAWLRSLPAETLHVVWFVVSFKTTSLKVYRDLVTIRKAAQALRWSVPLRGVLKAALQMCQTLDEVSLVTPDLDAFVRAKSIGGETSLLATLAEHVMDSEQSYLVSFTSTVLPYVNCVPSLLHALGGVRDLSEGVKIVLAFVANSIGDSECAGLAERLSGFAVMAAASVRQQRAKLAQLIATVEKLAVYFGLDPSTFDPDKLFDVLARFCGSFDANVKTLMASRAAGSASDDGLWTEGYSLAHDTASAVTGTTTGATHEYED